MRETADHRQAEHRRVEHVSGGPARRLEARADAVAERMAQVPELVGLVAAAAHDRALDAGLLAVARNAVHTGAGHGRVGAQQPRAGEQLPVGASVGIWIDGGAGAGPAGGADDGPPGGSGGQRRRPRPLNTGPAGAKTWPPAGTR